MFCPILVFFKNTNGFDVKMYVITIKAKATTFVISDDYDEPMVYQPQINQIILYHDSRVKCRSSMVWRQQRHVTSNKVGYYWYTHIYE